jgi:solute carrier family 13 (sodium-dependent dicarboxylate transporter), member 2/3/5
MSTQAATTEAEEKFEHWRQRIGMVLAPLVGLVLWFAPLPLAWPAHALAAIFAFTVVLWVTEAVPMAVASLLGPILCVIAGIAPMAKVFAPFANPIIFLFLGSFLLAEAMQKHGLDRRIALSMLAIPAFTRTPTRLFMAFGIMTALLSMWMSNTAITAVMLPILLGGLRAHPDLLKQRGLASGLVLMVAFSASIGGLATPVGTPTNLVALEQLEKAGLERPSFASWMFMGVPLMLVLIAALLIALCRRQESGTGSLAEEFRRQRQRLGGATRGEWMTGLVFMLAVTLWLLPGFLEMGAESMLAQDKKNPSPIGFSIGKEMEWIANWFGKHLPEELIGLSAGVLLFLLPGRRKNGDTSGGAVLEWKDTARVDWGTLLLFGGGFALGQQMRETGLADAIGKGVAAWLQNPSEGLLVAVAIVTSILLSEATSNTASAQIMVPLMIGVANATGADPQRVAMATCLACSLGFMLPISTPPNALAYGTGLVRLPSMVKYGLVLDVVGGVAVWCAVRWWL